MCTCILLAFMCFCFLFLRCLETKATRLHSHRKASPMLERLWLEKSTLCFIDKLSSLSDKYFFFRQVPFLPRTFFVARLCCDGAVVVFVLVHESQPHSNVDSFWPLIHICRLLKVLCSFTFRAKQTEKELRKTASHNLILRHRRFTRSTNTAQHVRNIKRPRNRNHQFSTPCHHNTTLFSLCISSFRVVFFPGSQQYICVPFCLYYLPLVSSTT